MLEAFSRVAVAVLVAMAFTVGAGVVAAGGDKVGKKKPKKVKVCHVPPGNPANAHVIHIPKKAFLKGHKKHGDFIVENKHDFKKCKKKDKKKKKHKKKVKVCHIPPGNPSNAHVIRIPLKAFFEGHLKHGDFLVKSKHDFKKCKHLGDTVDDGKNGNAH